MTNAQKWVFAFLLLFVVLFLLSRVLKTDETINEETNYYNEDKSTPENAMEEGLTLISNQGCVRCHGTDLNGTDLAPSLFDVKNYWSRDNLINYLRNPQSYSGDERFETYKEKYKSLMPPFNNVNVKDLGKIADYLLSLEN